MLFLSNEKYFKKFFKKLLTIIFNYAIIDTVRRIREMKKKYRLKEKWGVVLFYIVLVVLTIIYSGGCK